MYKNRVILLLGILVCYPFFSTAFAQVSVSPEPIIITQPDNSKLTIIGVGTANQSYTETIDGYTLLKNKKGIYTYAKPNKALELIPSRLRATDPANRKRKELKCLSKNFKPHLR